VENFSGDELRQRVMLHGKTEPPFTGKYLEHRQRGSYRCGLCRALLFGSQQKFHSGCGWPSFLAGSAHVLVRPDQRVEDALEVVCAECQGHLGHLFGSDHYCINSVALDFVEEDLGVALSGDFLRTWGWEILVDPDVRQRDQRGGTLLTYARQLAVARNLLEAGARVEDEDPEDGTTSVHWAAERGDLELLRELWPAGGEWALSRADFVGRTPLACAAGRGQLEAMGFLLERGASVDAWCPRRKGVTALHEAVFYQQRAAAALLLAHGADPDFAVGLNSSPREIAGDLQDLF